MPNLPEQAINDDDGDHAAQTNRQALGIESDEVTNQPSRNIGRMIPTSVRVSLVIG
jgi:hypothetical protein